MLYQLSISRLSPANYTNIAMGLHVSTHNKKRNNIKSGSTCSACIGCILSVLVTEEVGAGCYQQAGMKDLVNVGGATRGPM